MLLIQMINVFEQSPVKKHELFLKLVYEGRGLSFFDCSEFKAFWDLNAHE